MNKRFGSVGIYFISVICIAFFYNFLFLPHIYGATCADSQCVDYTTPCTSGDGCIQGTYSWNYGSPEQTACNTAIPGSSYNANDTCDTGGLLSQGDSFICCEPQAPPPPPAPASCSDIGGYCTNPIAGCPNSQGSGDFDSSCQPPSTNYCCEPFTCSQAASLQNAIGFCTNTQRGCVNSHGAVAGLPGDYPDCGIDYCCWAYPTPTPNPSCTGNPKYGPCQGATPNTCHNNATQEYHYTSTQPCNGNQIHSQTCSVDNCSANYACHNGLCETNIHIFVYTDYNHDEVKNGSDAGKQGVTVTDNGGNFPTTNANGQVIFSSKVTGTYNITMTVPSTFQAIGPTTNSVTLSNTAGNQTTNFFLTPLYQISGNVFNDTNKNGKDDNGESGYGGGTITVTGGPTTVNPITVANDGSWSTPNNLASGNYIVTYTTPLTTGYTYTTNSAWSVTVGDPAGGPQAPVCSTSTSLDATCGGQNNGSISNLNIGVTNENSHYQSACMDLRQDNNSGGTVKDQFPGPGATCGGYNGSDAIINSGDCSTGTGIAYSCNGTFDFGLGQASPNNWQAGGSSYGECYTPPGINNIRTSYNFLMATAQQSGITPIDMNSPSVCGAGGIADCVLPTDGSGNPTLPKGIYHADGNVVLDMASFTNSTYTLPSPADPTTQYQTYVFLINGNLTLTGGNLLIGQGSTAVFSAAGNIEVTKDVGTVVNSSNVNTSAVNSPNLEGIYSADQSFIVDSYGSGTSICNADGTPLDKKLNILGVVIDNAAQAGGNFVNNRDLCTFDNQCPSVCTGDCGGGGGGQTVDDQLLTLLADGQFVLHKNFNWQELKP